MAGSGDSERPELSNAFRVTVKALIYRDGHILLLRKPEGEWDLPGGRLDEGEDPKLALRREIREELGVKAKIFGLADCTIRRSKASTEIFVVSYRCDIKGSVKDIRLSKEHTEARYVPMAKVHGLDMQNAYKVAARRGFAKLRRNDDGLHPTAAEALGFLSISRVMRPL